MCHRGVVITAPSIYIIDVHSIMSAVQGTLMHYETFEGIGEGFRHVVDCKVQLFIDQDMLGLLLC